MTRTPEVLAAARAILASGGIPKTVEIAARLGIADRNVRCHIAILKASGEWPEFVGHHEAMHRARLAREEQDRRMAEEDDGYLPTPEEIREECAKIRRGDCLGGSLARREGEYWGIRVYVTPGRSRRRSNVDRQFDKW